jgi:hypothetical protein
MGFEDINDTFRREGEEGVRRRHDGAKRYTAPTAALSLDEWLARKLPAPDLILGGWLTTTSRILLVAPTGLGKTMFAVALGIRAAAGAGFLHWAGHRPARVLFVDGEMSRRLLKVRLADETRRSGATPATFFALSHEDIEDFAPLSTKEGQAIIDQEIERIGSADLVIFDNVMSLVGGDMKDEETWRNTMPWIRSLTRRHIAQIWVHHTGHDEGHSYGTKTREWQMDTVIHCETLERADTDVSFTLTFRKARERTPATRAEFAEAHIALLTDWTHDTDTTTTVGRARRKTRLSDRAMLARRSLANALCTSDAVAKDLPGSPRVTTTETWRLQAYKEGFASDVKPDSRARAFRRTIEELQVANIIGIQDDLVWLVAK